VSQRSDPAHATASPDTSGEWLDGAPLFQAWLRFVGSDQTPFTIPGHKRRADRLHPDLARLLDTDVPLYGGLDTVTLSGAVLPEAERLAATLWGADVCRFSTGGSTHANQVLCLTVGQPGDVVLVARNAHRSVLSGLVLAGLRPVWIDVRNDPVTGSALGLGAGDVRASLEAHPEAVALFCTEPSYQGTLSDLPAIVTAAHEHDIPVVVDQAWGAHLGFAPGFPHHAFQAGADAMVTSAHKMLPAFSQASLVLARTERIDADRLERAFEATHTTSPSGAILASIDASRALLGSPEGRLALDAMIPLVAGARDQLRDAGLIVPGPGDHPPGRFDPAKLVVHFGRAGRSGLDAEAGLRRRGVAVEMADHNTLVAQVGLTDDAATVSRLVAGILASLEGDPGPPRSVVLPAHSASPALLSPRDAFFAEYEVVARPEAIGRISAELVAPYPPGVPVLVPGEEVTSQALEALDQSLRAGNRIAYAADPTLATLHVVRSGRH
jgi:lysine decarboxylase